MPGSDINNRIPQIGGGDPAAPSPAPQGPQTPGAQASDGTGADATTFIPQNAAAQPTVVAPMQVAPGAHRRPGGAHGARAQRAAGGTTPAGAPAPGSPEGAHGSEKKPHRGKGHVARNVIIALALLLVIAYAGGVIAFTFLFYPHTSLAGVDISWQTSGAAAEKLEGAVAGYTLTVADEDLGFTWTYTPEGGRNIFNVEAAAQRRLAQNEPWAWPVRLYQALTDTPAAAAADADEAVEPDLSLLGAAFDRTAFETSLGEAIDTFNAGRGGAFTAQTAWDAEQGLFVPEKAYESRRLNRDAIITGALTALGDLEATFELADLGEDLYLPLDGEPTPEDMQADCDAANAFLGTNVTFKLGDSVAATLDASVIGPWITFDAQTEPTLNQDAVTQWAHNLAAQMNTVGTERTYTRPDGKTVTVSGGTFGWSVDEAALVQSVQDAVANHQTGEIAVPASSEGDTYAGAGQPDWKKYVDVDITEQYARLYDENGNLIWETGVVTGLDNGSDDTPTGVYKVNYKARNINLVSPDKDPETGEPEYISPVEYWIAWKGNAWGFHDASWQPAWVFSDPSAYHTYGSHGCINTPYDKVQQLYDLLQEGDCVVVHY
ncbi:MAG TPA: L,D-transpeptidase family protein [Candidatus Coprousia avicola]|nr:L,D-transpeptidase family protein [Candidatus Coprousia avicola]